MAKRIPEKDIRDFILDNIEARPSDLAKLISERFAISRQAVNYRIKKLIEEGLIISTGTTRNKKYSLHPIVKKNFSIKISSDSEEDKVWRDLIEPLMKGIPKNIVDICHYGFTEMFNNVIDHSESKRALINFEHLPNKIEIIISDYGVGIFNKIVRELRLDDDRHAILELAKGKLTTDPKRHTGEGIFFTSRMFDNFLMLSGKLAFHRFQGIDWLVEDREQDTKGTAVFMTIFTDSLRTTKDVFDKFSTEDDYGFTKTIVPISLAKYGEENLVSRSQAKRLMAGLDRFKEVILDFNGIGFIGQAFADEIFRVYKNDHPSIRITPVNTADDVKKMIERTSQAAK